jgi:hypothetical protein
VRLNARDVVLEPGRQEEYSLEQVDYISQDVKVLLRVQRIHQETLEIRSKLISKLSGFSRSLQCGSQNMRRLW